MKKMFIAERDRQYFINQELEKCQSEFNYLLSDNPACAGNFLAENYKPKLHDNANIVRCKRLATEILHKSEKIKTKITDHDNSLFSKTSGKLQTGLTCHSKFNSDMIHSITTGIQKNIGGSKSKSSVSRKKKENRKKSEHRKRRACIIFQSLGGSPVDWEYNPEIFGIPQIDNIDQETSLLFTSHTDKSCLRDLLSCKCFVGEAEVLLQSQLGI